MGVSMAEDRHRGTKTNRPGFRAPSDRVLFEGISGEAGLLPESRRLGLRIPLLAQCEPGFV